MGLELEHECPHCESNSFWRIASTRVGLGQKVKWECTGDDCDYRFVKINSTVDSSVDAATA